MRNIILVTWDSVRAGHCNCYGYHKKTTPFLDKLANKGLKFNNSIVGGLATLNSMGSIFTSKHFNQNKIKSEKTLAQVLSENKVKTAAFHTNPRVSRYTRFDKGFDQFKDYIEENENSSSFLDNAKDNLIQSLKRIRVDREAKFASSAFNYAIRNKDLTNLGDEGIYDDSTSWINSLKGNSNYFLWILLVDTHYPYTPPDLNIMKRIRLLYTIYKFYKSPGIEKKNPLQLDENERKNLINAYDGEIRHVDNFTRMLWKELKHTDPIFIVHADHGEAFGEHGFYGHPPEHYEYLARVPLVIYNADEKGVHDKPTSLLNLAPTICKFAGVKNEFDNPSFFEKPSHSPIIENEVDKGLKITVRDEDWKLITNPEEEDELYNIKDDPLEKENLVGRENDIEKELRLKIKEHKKMKTEKEGLTKSVGKLKRQKRI